MMAGCILGKILCQDFNVQNSKERIQWAAVFAIGSGASATWRAYAESESSSVAVVGSIGMAMLVCGLTAMMGKTGLRLRV